MSRGSPWPFVNPVYFWSRDIIFSADNMAVTTPEPPNQWLCDGKMPASLPRKKEAARTTAFLDPCLLGAAFGRNQNR